MGPTGTEMGVYEVPEVQPKDVTAATDKASGRDSSRESPDFSCRGEWGEFEKWGAPFLSGRSSLLLFEEMCVTLVAEKACRAVGL